MRWPFAKYVGCGNDFILLDNRQGLLSYSPPQWICHLCHRQQGIGADGVLVLENSLQADFRMRIFNSDSSEAEMCGNGLRCFVKWLATLDFHRPLYRIEVMKRVLSAFHVEEAIGIEMGDLSDVQWNIPILYHNQTLNVHHLNTGVPHVVLFMENIDSVPLRELGAYLRHHPHWKPKGTNVTIAQQMGTQTFKIRTYERGIEGETLACGTGATAAALAAAYLSSVHSPIQILTLSGEKLYVEFLFSQQSFSQIKLIGSARCTFQGEFDFSEMIPFSIACNSGNSVKS